MELCCGMLFQTQPNIFYVKDYVNLYFTNETFRSGEISLKTAETFKGFCLISK